ncbi:MAG: four-carbon acid sugar kinase family protein [Thermomicrobiales bacterium]
MRQTGRRAVIIAPALPDQARMTVDGNVYVNDVLLTESPLGVGRCFGASVVELLGLPGDLGRSIGLETVRAEPILARRHRPCGAANRRDRRGIEQ